MTENALAIISDDGLRKLLTTAQAPPCAVEANVPLPPELETAQGAVQP